ncbi:hypothetical protein ACMG4P_21690 [Pseudovibrio denitrificans]|uniref:hypothetical protein n=1 Tax=Pseudovibrio denitrificans TaxID=258256 RepID=UPI0039BFE5F8
MRTSTLSVRIPQSLDDLLKARADSLDTTKSVTVKQILKDALMCEGQNEVSLTGITNIEKLLEQNNLQLKALIELALSAAELFEADRGS